MGCVWTGPISSFFFAHIPIKLMVWSGNRLIGDIHKTITGCIYIKEGAVSLNIIAHSLTISDEKSSVISTQGSSRMTLWKKTLMFMSLLHKICCFFSTKYFVFFFSLVDKVCSVCDLDRMETEAQDESNSTDINLESTGDDRQIDTGHFSSNHIRSNGSDTTLVRVELEHCQQPTTASIMDNQTQAPDSTDHGKHVFFCNFFWRFFSEASTEEVINPSMSFWAPLQSQSW